MIQAKETSKYRWVILGILWSTYTALSLNRFSVWPLAPFLREDLGITSTHIGAVMSVTALGTLVPQLLIGWLVDKIGGRWPVATGCVISGTSMIALFFAQSYTLLLMLMFVTGIGFGFLLPSTAHGVISWFPLRERATAMGLVQTAINIGGIIAAATLPAVALALGCRYGFLFIGIIAIAIGVTALVFYKQPPRLAYSRFTDSEKLPRAAPFLEILKNRKIWLASICGWFFAYIQFTIIAHLVLYLTDVVLLPPVTAGGLLAIAQSAGILSRPGGGLLSDRVFGGRRKPVLMLMACTSSTICFILGLFGSYLFWAIYPIIFLLGIGGISFSSIFHTLVSELGGRHAAGKAVGLFVTIAAFGAVVGPTVFGYMVDTAGSYELAWISLAFMAAVSILLLLFVQEGKGKT